MRIAKDMASKQTDHIQLFNLVKNAKKKTGVGA